MMNNRLLIMFLAIALLGAKCTEVDVTDPNVAATMTELNASWKEGYNEMLNDVGTRHYNIQRTMAFNGIKRVVEEMGFDIIISEGNYYLGITIPAGNMFTETEWERVRQADEPNMKSIAAKHLGFKGRFDRLEPEGLLINGVVTLIESNGGTNISLTFRLQSIKPQPIDSILPRREYPPPYASRIGFEKIWQRFESLALPIAKLAESG